MKTVLTKFLAISSVALLMLASCKKNDPIVTTNGGTPGVLATSTTTVVLNKANAGDTTTKVITFSTTAPQYTYKAAVTNTIQIDSVGDNWASPSSIALPQGVLTQGLTTAVLNTALLQIVPGGITSKVNVRIQYALSSAVATYSNVISLTVTPYSLASYIYIVGAFQGWNATSPDSLVSNTSNGVYTGTFTFPAGAGNNQFLILPAKNFNNKYATNDPVTLVPSATVAYNGPNNFNAPATAGAYTITFNVNALTIGFNQ
jgi:hypothetical protein